MRKFLLLLFFGVVGAYLLWPEGTSESGPDSETTAQAEAPTQIDGFDPSTGLPQPRRRRPANGKVPGEFEKELAQIDRMLQDGDADGAIAHLEALLAQNPGNERALEELGMIYLTEKQDPQAASEYFKRSLNINANNEFALMELVGISTHPDRAESAIGYLQQLQEKNPDSAVVADGLGELYMSQGRLDDAIPQLEKSARDPRYAEFAFTRMASVYQQKGNTPKAIESYRRSILHSESEIERRQAQGGNTEMVRTDLGRTRLEMAQLLWAEGRREEAQEQAELAQDVLGTDDWEVQAFLSKTREP